jgi:hypothetical protein
MPGTYCARYAEENAAADASATTPKGKGKRALVAIPVHPKSESGLLSTCGHVGCVKCLKSNAELQECGVPGCDCPARWSSVVEATSLGTEKIAGAGAGAGGSKSVKAAKATPKSPAKVARRGKGPTDDAHDDALNGPTNEALELGVHGTKMAHLVQRIRDTPKDERVLVFVQFPDLMKQVYDVLEVGENSPALPTLTTCPSPPPPTQTRLFLVPKFLNPPVVV